MLNSLNDPLGKCGRRKVEDEGKRARQIVSLRSVFVFRGRIPLPSLFLRHTVVREVR